MWMCMRRLCDAANASRKGPMLSELAHCVYRQCGTFAVGACRALKRRTMRIALKVFALSEICMHGYCVALRVFAHPQILSQKSKSEPLGARASTCMHTEHVLGCISCVSMHAQACTCACKGAHTHTRYRLKSSEFCPGKSLISSLLLRSYRWDLSKCGGPPHYAMAMHANFRKRKDF